MKTDTMTDSELIRLDFHYEWGSDPIFLVKLTKPAVKYYENSPPKIKNKVSEVIN